MNTQIRDSHNRVCKIFDIEYLKNTELTEEDLHYLFDTSSLIYSLIIAEIRMAGYSVPSDEQIIRDIIVSNDWLNQYQWTRQCRDKFVSILTDVFKNIYQVQENTARQRAEMFSFGYGLSFIHKNQGSKKAKYAF